MCFQHLELRTSGRYQNSNPVHWHYRNINCACDERFDYVAFRPPIPLQWMGPSLTIQYFNMINTKYHHRGTCDSEQEFTKMIIECWNPPLSWTCCIPISNVHLMEYGICVGEEWMCHILSNAINFIVINAYFSQYKQHSRIFQWQVNTLWATLDTLYVHPSSFPPMLHKLNDWANWSDNCYMKLMLHIRVRCRSRAVFNILASSTHMNVSRRSSKPYDMQATRRTAPYLVNEKKYQIAQRGLFHSLIP